MNANWSDGAGLVARMADAAVAKACARTNARLALTRCDDVEISRPLPGETPVAIEAWIVRCEPGGTIISVFATAPNTDGRERLIAHGRFTLKPFRAEREIAA